MRKRLKSEVESTDYLNNMLNDTIRHLFTYWYNKGLQEGRWEDGIKFFYFYLCLNILMANISGERTDYGMLTWTKKHRNVLRTAFNNKLEEQSFREHLELLRSESPILDSRPHSNKRTYLRNIESMGQVLNTIYQIRCNFFHGNKPLAIPRNERLITTSTHILQEWMSALL